MSSSSPNPTKSQPMNLYLVTHGNVQPDHPAVIMPTTFKRQRLSEAGIVQAQKAGTFLGLRLAQECDKEPNAFGDIFVWFNHAYADQETAYEIIKKLTKHFYHGHRSSVYLDYKMVPYLTKLDGGGDMDDHLMRSRELLRDIEAEYFDDRRPRQTRQMIVVAGPDTIKATMANVMNDAPEWLLAERTPAPGSVRYLSGSRRYHFFDKGTLWGPQGEKTLSPRDTQKRIPRADQIVMLRPRSVFQRPPDDVPVLDPLK